jgi:hypothetical protein
MGVGMSVGEREEQIRSVIGGLWPTFRGREGDWTRATFEALRDLGARYGYERLYSPKCGGPGEWLWDFLWCQRDPKSGHISGLPLVVESEWGKPTVQRDFEKRLRTGSPTRRCQPAGSAGG